MKEFVMPPLKEAGTVQQKLFRVQTVSGSFEWIAGSMLHIVMAFQHHDLEDTLLGVHEVPQDNRECQL